MLGTCWINPLDLLYVRLHVALGAIKIGMTFYTFKPAAKQEDETSFWPCPVLTRNAFVQEFSVHKMLS